MSQASGGTYYGSSRCRLKSMCSGGMLHGYLPTKVELKRRHLEKEEHCEACGYAPENIFHVAVECPYVRTVRRAVKELIGCKISGNLSVGHCQVRYPTIRKHNLYIVCEWWALWKVRNARRHDRASWDPDGAAHHVVCMI